MEAGPTGIEPAAYGFLRSHWNLRVRRSGLTDCSDSSYGHAYLNQKPFQRFLVI